MRAVELLAHLKALKPGETATYSSEDADNIEPLDDGSPGFDWVMKQLAGLNDASSLVKPFVIISTEESTRIRRV